MIVTGTDMYNYVLEACNKEQTGTIFPSEFEYLINSAQLDVVKNRYAEIEFSQKRIDDLRVLVEGPSVVVNSGNNAPGEEVFSLPYQETINSGDNHGYLFMLNVAFKLQYVNDNCGEGESDWIKSKPMRTDRENEIERDPFNKPTTQRLYHALQGNELLAYTGSDSYAIEARIRYLRYPRYIEIDQTQVDCELPVHIRQEICDYALRKRLEQSESQRYQTNLIEGKQVNV